MENYMALFAPEVKGPVSPCSKYVRVRGHIAGATIHVLVNGTETFSRVSNWPDDFLDIGVTVAAGDKITATQEFNGETSPESPLPVVVQQLPGALAHLTVATHLYECGSKVWTEGSVPGAEVEVSIGNASVGTGNSLDGIARIDYSPPLAAGEVLTLKQSTCNGLSKTSTSQPADALPNKLPLPLIHEPLIECQTAIKIGNILGGATVIIYRDGVETNKGAFDLDTLTWIGLDPLKEGEKIEVAQAFFCKRESKEPALISDRAKAKVKPADEVGEPTILKPVCPKPILVTVTNLVPSARVILYENGTSIGMTDTPEVSFSFPVASLTPNSKLTARMQFCGVDGPLSEEVKVEDKSEPLQYLSVSKLFECAAHIFIRNDVNLKGKIVYATSAKLGHISAYHQVFMERFLLPVAPSLVADDEITLHVIGCGGDEQEFGPHVVSKLERLQPPKINEPVVENSTMVEVISNVAGALIKLYVDNAYKGQAISRGDQSYTPVFLNEPLKLKQRVKATHSLCSVTSKASNDAEVVVPPPQPPILLEPANNAGGISQQGPTFKWKDGGAGTSAAATSYDFSLHKGNNLVTSQTTNSTSLSLGSNLDYSTEYRWKVEAKNSTGSATSSTWKFTTMEEPAPEPPEEAVLLFTTSLYASHDGYTQIWPAPANQSFYICIGVGNAGNAVSPASEIVFAMSQGSTPLGTLTAAVGALQPGESVVAYALVNPTPEGQYLFEAALMVNGQAIGYTSWGAWIGF